MLGPLEQPKSAIPILCGNLVVEQRLDIASLIIGFAFVSDVLYINQHKSNYDASY